MTEPRLRNLSAVARLPVFYRFGAPCTTCGRVFRNEQGLAGHRYHRHGGHRHD